jgi:signal transduction histidine kinase
MRPSVRLRLTAWYASIFLLCGAVLLAISYVIVSRNTTNFPVRVEKKLTAQGGVAVAVPAGAGADTVPPTTLPPVGPLVQPDRAYLLKLEEARKAAEHTVTGDLRRETMIDFAFALVGTTLISVLGGWIVAGRALRPVARITATARKVAAEGDLGQRIALDGPADELRELADTFDAMLARLDLTFASQRSFVANASHELRTPLAIIRAEIEERLDDPQATKADLQAMANVVHDAVARSEALITSLLILARGQAPVRRHDRVDLAELIRAVVADNEVAAAALGVNIEATCVSAACHGDRQLLERLVTNLIENALHHNYPGGFIRIALSETDHYALLQVTNSGELVPAAAVPHLFDPFFRIDESRSRESGGAGLGLSIVAAVATAHEGQAAAAARQGGGLIVTVTLPTDAATRKAERGRPPDDGAPAQNREQQDASTSETVPRPPRVPLVG